MLRHELEILIEQCLITGNFTGHSGKTLSWMADLLKIQPYFSQIMELFSPQFPMAGICTGGWLLVASTEAHGNGAIMIKDAEVYNYDCPTAVVSLFDDVVTTGGSFWEAEKLLSKKGITVGERFCVLDRRGITKRKEYKIKSLFLSHNFGLEETI